jgi:hypothetical protein
MDNYTFREYADMHLILGEARGNGAAAVKTVHREESSTHTSELKGVSRH